MAMKKGYKQTEVGTIPEDWQSAQITNIANSVFLGLTSKVDYVSRQGIPLVRASDIADGHLCFNSARTISFRQHEELTKYRKAKRGDVLVSKSGSLGVCALVDTDVDFSIYESIIVVQPAKTTNSTFLLWALRDENTQTRMIGDKVGSTVSHLNLETFRTLMLALPPTLHEQEAIAGALSDADAWIESLGQLIAKKRQIKQGAMQELLTGKRRLPGFSGKWISRMLPEVSHFRGGKAHEQYITDNAEYVCVNSKFISTEGKVRKYTTENFCSARAGDILMVMSDLPNGKALAKTFIADKDNLYAVNQRVCALTPRENYSSEFLAFVLDRNAYFLRFDDGVNQTHLLNRVFEKCPLVVPATKAEQTAIATILSDMDTEIESLESKLSKARGIKQGMMQELLTGRIRLIEN